MKISRFLLSLALLSMCFNVLTSDASAWEFSMRGVTTYTQLYYAQRGNRGFFGPFDFDMSAALTGATINPHQGQKPNGLTTFAANAFGDFAPANAWLGGQVNQIVSGSDASRGFYTTNLYPRIQVHPALRLEGVYRIGNSDTYTFPGTTVSFANGEWLTWYATVQSPWGLIVYGKRPFGFGCGLQYDVLNRSEEYLSLSVPFGPVTLGAGVYPWRRAFQILNPVSNVEIYWNQYDRNNSPEVDLFAFLQYAAGPLEMGIGGTYTRCHFGPEGFQNAVYRTSLAPLNLEDSEGWIFLKFTNGRVFFNAEADWYYRTARFHQSSAGNFATPDTVVLPETETTDGSGSVFRTRYTEMWRFMAELGVISGPAKVSILYSWIPGPDRRHGVLIDRQPVLVDVYRPYRDLIIQSPALSNSTLFQSYSFLLNSAYGSGVNATSYQTVGGASNGYMTDASMYGLRLDYAVAANLNICGSVFHADRVSHGYSWGYIYLDRLSGANPRFFTYFEQIRNFTTPAPSIPDNDLGWEVNVGATWGLLENWMLSCVVGYWAPGKWFNYACIDKAVPAWNYFTPAASWGINPNRIIEPVVGMNWSLTVGF